MEFCKKCGILLNISLILDKSTEFCTPCFEASNRTDFGACECELCGPRHQDNTLSLQEDSTSSDLSIYCKVNPTQKPLLQKTQKKHKKYQNKSIQQSGLSKKSEFRSLQYSEDFPSLPSYENRITQFDVNVGSSALYLNEGQWSSVEKNWPSQEKEACTSFPEPLEDWGDANLVSPFGRPDDWSLAAQHCSSPFDNMGLTSSISKTPKANSDAGNSEVTNKHSSHNKGKNYHIMEEVRVTWERYAMYRFGLACHLGVVLDIPTMGVAKSLISAQGISEDEDHKKMKRTLAGAGDNFDLVSDSGEVLGNCLRVHDGAPNPVYISVGHRVSLESAKWLALECSMYRIPEPVRRADLDSREYLRQGKTCPEEFVYSGDEMEQ
ncbi:endonuclease V [Elysia marginata]|uniref:Endonuclease V n=1 Tax=Elysia marginata TaxID=1093978 RepID=A0AAV4JC47_9GAST|nr:endonuclease V [Elysia marginata]